jgi:hypothetical protein
MFVWTAAALLLAQIGPYHNFDSGLFFQRLSQEKLTEYVARLELAVKDESLTAEARAQSAAELLYVKAEPQRLLKTLSLHKRFPSNTRIGGLASRLLADAGKLDEAKAILRGLQDNTSSTDLGLLELLLEPSDSLLANAANIAESDPYAFLVLAKHYHRKREFASVLQYVNLYLSAHNEGPALEPHLPFSLRAKALAETGAPLHEVRASLETAFKLNPRDDSTAHALWQLETANGNSSGSLAIAQTWFESSQSTLSAVTLSKSLASQHKTQMAMQVLREAITLNPSDDSLALHYANLLLHEAEFENAKSVYATILNRSQSSTAAFGLAMTIAADESSKPNELEFAANIAAKAFDSDFLNFSQRIACVECLLRSSRYPDAAKALHKLRQDASTEELEAITRVSQLLPAAESK